jgi:hypothetical protein
MKNVTPGHPDADATTANDAHLPPEAVQRLRRLRRVAWVLDRVIPIGGGRRVGIDPLIGLIPGAGDWIATLLSVYILYEAARLGLPVSVLARIAFNIALEGIIGTVPVAGDLFDFIFQANMRNLRLVERYYRPDLRPRSFAHIWLAIGAFTFALLAFLGIAFYAMIKVLWMLFSG